MNSKPYSPFDGQEAKVDELRAYARWTKRLFVFTLATAIVNMILTYGLIFHPSKPSPVTCAQFCTPLESRLSYLPVARTAATSPSTFYSNDDEIPQVARDDNPREIAVRVSDDVPSSDVAVRSPGDLVERADFSDVKAAVAIAMGGVWITNQAISWWNMVPACQDFGSSGTNKVNCVWGAITTVITAAGSGYTIWQGAGRISTWMNNNGISIGGFKRDAVDQELLDGLSNWFGNDVTHLGVWDHSHLNLGGSLNARTDAAPLDVFGMKSASGHDIHFSYLGNGNGKPTFKFGFNAPKSNSTTSRFRGRAESYDYQYFTDGGIDFILDTNPSDGGTLDTYSDYWWVYDQVSCIMNTGDAMSAAGHYFQIYDNVHEGTIAGGSVAPFRGSDHWSVIPQMYNLPTPVPETAQCES